MALFNCCFYRAEYLSVFNAVHIVFKGKVDTDEVIRLRNNLESLAESLKIEKLILDFTECDLALIDYNSQSRITFWRNMENHGLKMILLINPPNNFTENSRKQRESYYNENRLNIDVSAISDRKLMPLFIINDTCSSQIN